jgi:hypothetical protein
VTFGLDSSRDQGERFTRRRELKTQSVGESFTAYSKSDEIHQEAFAMCPQRFRCQSASDRQFGHGCVLFSIPPHVPFILDSNAIALCVRSS